MCVTPQILPFNHTVSTVQNQSMICELAPLYIQLNNPLCALIKCQSNATQEAFIVFIRNGFVNLKWEQQYQQSWLIEINYWPLFTDSWCWKDHCRECSQGWNHLIWISDKNMCLLPVSIPSLSLKLIPKKNKRACSTLFWPKIATFLSSLACFIGEEFREARMLKYLRIQSSPLTESTSWQRTLPLLCPLWDSVDIKTSTYHNNVFKCLSHQRIIESLFAYYPSLCFT